MRTQRYTFPQIAEQLGAYVFADILLRFFGRSADVRSEQHIGQSLQRRDEGVTVLFGLFGKYIDCGTADLSALDGLAKGRQVDHLATCVVDDDRTGLTVFKVGLADEVFSLRGFGNVQ